MGLATYGIHGALGKDTCVGAEEAAVPFSLTISKWFDAFIFQRLSNLENYQM